MNYMIKISEEFRRSAERNNITNKEIKLLIKEIKQTIPITEDEFLYVFEKNEKIYGLYGEMEYLENKTIILTLHLITKTIEVNR